MAITQTEIDELETAIHALATGKVQRYSLRDGRQIFYFQLSEMRELLTEYKKQFASTSVARSMAELGKK